MTDSVRGFSRIFSQKVSGKELVEALLEVGYYPVSRKGNHAILLGPEGKILTIPLHDTINFGFVLALIGEIGVYTIAQRLYAELKDENEKLEVHSFRTTKEISELIKVLGEKYSSDEKRKAHSILVASILSLLTMKLAETDEDLFEVRLMLKSDLSKIFEEHKA